MDYATRTTTPAKALPLRLGRSIWRQAKLTPRCPDTPRLDGKLGVVTGGNAGIGKEIARGLAQRGAEVIIAARNTSTASAAATAISKETGAVVRQVPLDLADLVSVSAAADALAEVAAGRTIDVLVANAG